VSRVQGDSRASTLALVHLLERLRDVLLRHPMAAQAAFASLVAEGRRFAATSEGEAWKQRLVGSELLERLEVVWRTVGMNAFVEQPTEVLPSFFLDGAIRAAARRGLEPLLAAIFDAKD
jgi:hypothetical protein